jgi:serine/threonine-protein kinase
MTDPGAFFGPLRDALAKEYELEGFVGRGSIALLYKGAERVPRRAVGIKVIPPDAATGLGERVRREARVGTNLVNANIVPLYKVGQAAGADYYTVKWVDGCSLNQVMAEVGQMPVPLALTVLRSVVRGLAYAHDRRVLHRDLCGAKVLVDRDGTVAVADTGIARALREGTSEASVGSVLFRSPEQCSGQQVAAQADQYSLGVLAFQMLTGKLPFEAESDKALLELHVSAQPPEIGMTRLDVPQELVDLVRRALAKTPAERFATTREMLLAIQAVPLSEDDQKAAVEQLQEVAARAPEPTLVTEAGVVPPAPPAAPPPVPVVAPAPPPPVRVVAPAPPPPPAPEPAAVEPPPAPAPLPPPPPVAAAPPPPPPVVAEPVAPPPAPPLPPVSVTSPELEMEWPEPPAHLSEAARPPAPLPEPDLLPQLDLMDVAPAPAPEPPPKRRSQPFVPLPAPPPAPITWEPQPGLAPPPLAPPPVAHEPPPPPRLVVNSVVMPLVPQPPAPPSPSGERGGWGPPTARGDWEPTIAPPPPEPPPAARTSSPGAAGSRLEPEYGERPPEPRRSTMVRPAVQMPARKSPVAKILGGVAAVGVLAAVALVFLGRGDRTAGPREPTPAQERRAARAAVADSAAAKARADSIATFAPVALVGWIRVHGDLPDDAVIWLDSKRMRGSVFPASPGRHTIQVITDEFEPWESRIRVQLGDTLTVEVELVLVQPQPDQQP